MRGWVVTVSPTYREEIMTYAGGYSILNIETETRTPELEISDSKRGDHESRRGVTLHPRALALNPAPQPYFSKETSPKKPRNSNPGAIVSPTYREEIMTYAGGHCTMPQTCTV
jgi:hypothetical protein